VCHGANIYHKDSRGNDALDDAIREKREDVVKFLQQFIEKKNREKGVLE